MAQVVGTVVYGLNSQGIAKPILVDTDGTILLDGSGNLQAGPGTGPMVGVLLVGIDSSGTAHAVKLS